MFFKKLETFSEGDSVKKLINACFYKRASSSEKFLFDSSIPVLLNSDYSLKISGNVQHKDGFRKHKYILDPFGLISIGNKIKFSITATKQDVNLFKWKVKNDNTSVDPRGEITDNQTLRGLEETKFKGNHYVECYAILNDICVARARQNVKIKG